MDLEIAPDLHRQPWAGVEARQARLGAAPDAHAEREVAVDGARDRKRAVDEQVAAFNSDDAALEVGIEAEAPRKRALVHACFGEQGEIASPAAEAADALAALGCQPHG